MFQIIVFRYTGRIYRFELYRKEQEARSNCKTRIAQQETTIPVRDTLGMFLNHVKLHLNLKNRNQMSDWVSKQHDGSVSPDCVRNFATFARFLKNVSYKLETTIENMRSIRQIDVDDKTQREKCVGVLEGMLAQSLYECGAQKFGRVKWIAHLAVSDLEEFVIDPFDKVRDSSIAEGKYSQEGLDMVNRALANRINYGECLGMIVSYIHGNTPMEHLRVLGYDKIDNVVFNIVNERQFSAVDAEHFLCKAWIIAKSTFGNAHLSNYPNQCSAHTHPSRVLHEMTSDEISNHMQAIEDAYTSCMEGDQAVLVLPELCKLSGEG
jgi:hypothetical protein